ncbi:MAG: NAD(P)-dependent dehydrogenase (short-subunit alcohol dehydrogenase family) [Acidimicrobiales bacterium]|jgi:meso-butanediol dehydrogenase / (S,S)-butanediol dehydrogenase / diacetyl reductase
MTTDSTPSGSTTALPLTSRKAVVTGGGRGIGRSIALRFAADGCDVVVTGRTTTQLDTVVTEAAELPGRVVAITCDVGSPESVISMVEQATAAVGAIDTVVNNAGVHAAGPFMKIDPDVFRNLFETNVIGIVHVCQALLPSMMDAGFGRIINVASTAGLFESAGQSPYNTSKHAVVGLTRCMALEMAPTGVTVNAICPGFVDTPMLGSFADAAGVELDTIRERLAKRTPMGRILDPDEIAHLALYLASDLAGGMTGQTIAISNGMRMH